MSEMTSASQHNTSAATRAYPRRVVAPPVDVYENADEVILFADVPGVGEQGIDVRVENDTLTLEAKRSQAKAAEDSPALVREYEELDYSASFRIPAGIDVAAITAQTNNGTLKVRLPKAAAAKPRKIAVRSES